MAQSFVGNLVYSDDQRRGRKCSVLTSSTVDYCGQKAYYESNSVQSELSARQLTVHRLQALQAQPGAEGISRGPAAKEG